MTLIEVLDTAVKIGLGAIISGIAAHLLAKHSHTRDLKKISYARRQDGLESVAESAEQHFAAWRRLCSIIGGIYSGKSPPNPDFSKEQWDLIRDRDKLFIDTSESLGRAIARLRLLDAQDAANRLNDFIKPAATFRDRMMLQKETPNKEEFDRMRKETAVQIAAFHSEVSKVYLSLSS